MPTYYTESGQKIRNPEAYASTGAPMYETKYGNTKDVNAPTTIYKMNLKNGKKYIGKTTDVDRRMEQHFSGNGSKVTKNLNQLVVKLLMKYLDSSLMMLNMNIQKNILKNMVMEMYVVDIIQIQKH